MPTIRTRNDLLVTLPDDYQLVEPPGAIQISDFNSQDPLLEAVRDPDMVLLDHFVFTPAATLMRRAASAADVSVPLEGGENAVILLEQDGTYTWQYPRKPSARAIRDTATHHAFFRIELPGPATLLSKARNALFKHLTHDSMTDIVGNFVLGRIKAYVLKFFAPVVVDRMANFLGRKERYGFVDMGGNDSQEWTFKQNLLDLILTEQEQPARARILLFIHGTFSTTEGAFGVLKSYPWGREFLKSARGENKYDAVLGFNHITLSDDPCANAKELLRQLRKKWPDPVPQIDIIAHSRGGLVTRSLIEHLLPKSSWKPDIGCVIFVACTNRGTLFASPQRWKKLADWYSNLVITPCLLFKLMPNASVAVTAGIVKEAVTGLSDFVKYASTYTLKDDGVPGLAAMRPDGPFITEINQPQPNQPTKEETFYCAITSRFKASLFADGLKELPKCLGLMVASGFSDRLMGEPHDLVVNTASMKAIDKESENFIKDCLDFTASPHLHHLTYFAQPRIVNALTHWLGLEESNNDPSRTRLQASSKKLLPPDNWDEEFIHRSAPNRKGYWSLNPTGRMKRKGYVSGTELLRLLMGEEPRAIVLASRNILVMVDTNFIHLEVDTNYIPLDPDAKTLSTDLRKKLKEKPQAQACIVTRRMRENEEMYYALELFPELLADDQKLIEAINLHECKTLSADDLIKMSPFTDSLHTGKMHWWHRLISASGLKRRRTNDSQTKMPTVVTRGGKPVGILPKSIEPLSSKQLEELAKSWVQQG